MKRKRGTPRLIKSAAHCEPSVDTLPTGIKIISGLGESANSTATFVRQNLSLLAEGINQAWAVSLQIQLMNHDPRPEVIRQAIPIVDKWCTDADIKAFLDSPKQRTPRNAAAEIIGRKLPSYPLASILRMARKTTPKKEKKT